MTTSLGHLHQCFTTLIVKHFFLISSLYLLPLGGAEGQGTGVGSVHHTLSLPLLPPQGEDSSCSSPAPAWGSLPRETVLYQLHQHGSLPRGAGLQEQTAPAWIPCGITSPASRPAPAWTSHGATASFGHIHLLQHGVLPRSSPLAAGESAPASGAPPPFSFFTDLGVCKVVSLIVSLLSLDCCPTAGSSPS